VGLVPAVIAVAWVTRRRTPLLTTVGAVWTLLGCLSASPLLVPDDLLAYLAVTEGLDVATVAALDDAWWALPVTGAAALLFISGIVVGLPLLGIALWRSRVAPRWMALALIIGGATHPFLPNHVVAGIGLLVAGIGFAGASIGWFAMTGRDDDLGRTLRSVLLEESNVMPVDTHRASEGLRRRVAQTHKRWRVTLAVAASVVAAAVAVSVAGGWLGVNMAADPAQNPDQAEAVAREFLDAYGRFDTDTALGYLTNDAIDQGAVEGWTTPEEFRLGLAHYRVQGYTQTINDCEQVGNSEAGVNLVCAFDMHGIRSDEIGLGPYTGNHWDLTVHDGKIVSAKWVLGYISNGFSDQMWEPFAHWVSIDHPDDVLAMYTDSGQRQRMTEDSNRLWEQRTAEYVTVVKQNPAKYLDQPEIAAWVAQLDSICAAAQASVKDVIRVMPHRDRPAVIKTRDRIMRETISELRALGSPKAVRWPYLGRAFPLMENLYVYGKLNQDAQPHDKQQAAWLLRQIQQTPGLDKCSFPV
jgi:hypothetical protein